MSILSVAVFSVTFFPQINTFLSTLGEKILKQYPSELEIVITKGKTSASVPQPYFIQMPKEWRSNEHSKPNDIENMLVIDTKDPFSVETFKGYKTACLLNQTSFTCYDNNNSMKIVQIPADLNLTVNKTDVKSFIGKAEPYLKFVLPILFTLLLIVFFFIYAGYLLYLIFGAFVIWLVSKIRKIEMTYKKSYRLGIHLMTAPIILMPILNLIPGSPLSVPFLFTIILIGMSVINLKQETTSETLPPAEEPTTPATP
jgi:hypothetical protein